MARQRKYATLEEARAAAADKLRAYWRDPLRRGRWVLERKNRGLSPETMAQFLREYVEREGRGWRYSIEDIGRRYLLSPSHVMKLASRAGVRRRPRKIDPEPERIAA